MHTFMTSLSRRKDIWALKVTTPAGEKRVYRYGSEREARYFAAIFEMGPTFIPSDPIEKKTSKRGRRRPSHGRARLST